MFLFLLTSIRFFILVVRCHRNLAKIRVSRYSVNKYTLLLNCVFPFMWSNLVRQIKQKWIQIIFLLLLFNKSGVYFTPPTHTYTNHIQHNSPNCWMRIGLSKYILFCSSIRFFFLFSFLQVGTHSLLMRATLSSHTEMQKKKKHGGRDIVSAAFVLFFLLIVCRI